MENCRPSEGFREDSSFVSSECLLAARIPWFCWFIAVCCDLDFECLLTTPTAHVWVVWSTGRCFWELVKLERGRYCWEAIRACPVMMWMGMLCHIQLAGSLQSGTSKSVHQNKLHLRYSSVKKSWLNTPISTSFTLMLVLYVSECVYVSHICACSSIFSVCQSYWP